MLKFFAPQVNTIIKAAVALRRLQEYMEVDESYGVSTSKHNTSAAPMLCWVCYGLWLVVCQCCLADL